MARKSIKRAIAAAILVAASLGVGAAAALPANAAAKPVSPALYLCYPMYKTIPDSQLGNYDVIRILSTWVSGGVRYDFIYYNTNQACKE